MGNYPFVHKTVSRCLVNGYLKILFRIKNCTVKLWLCFREKVRLRCLATQIQLLTFSVVCEDRSNALTSMDL